MLIPRLNRSLRPQAYQKVFKVHGRLHIPDILHPPTASALHSALTGSRDWVRSVHLTHDQDVNITMAELEAMSTAERTELEQNLVDSSTDKVKYMFDRVRISTEILAGAPVPEPMDMIHQFVNSRPFLDFMSRLTGDSRLAFADVMATRYLPGHFATVHGDEIPGLRRLYAYVLNLTPEWRADWGGILLFHDEDGHISEGYVPRFNALNVFAVPQSHSVSVVSRLAEAPRLSITGWIHGRD